MFCDSIFSSLLDGSVEPITVYDIYGEDPPDSAMEVLREYVDSMVESGLGTRVGTTREGYPIIQYAKYVRSSDVSQHWKAFYERRIRDEE